MQTPAKKHRKAADDDVEELLAKEVLVEAGDILDASPCLYQISLGVLTAAVNAPPNEALLRRFFMLRSGGVACGFVAIDSSVPAAGPRASIAGSIASETTQRLLTEFRECFQEVRSVCGDEAPVKVFAAAFASAWKAIVSIGIEAHAMLLREPPRIPSHVPGRLRKIASQNEDAFPTLVQWHGEFACDALGHIYPQPPTLSESTNAMSKLADEGKLFLWEDDCGVPCAMAAVGRKLGSDGFSLNLVFSDRAQRGKSFGMAVVAALCARLMGTCKFVALFADAREGINTRRVYERVGFEITGFHTQRLFSIEKIDHEQANLSS